MKDRIEGDVVLDEVMLHLPVTLLLLVETLRMQVVQQLVHGHQAVNHRYAQANHRAPRPRLADQTVKDDLAGATHDQRNIQQLYRTCAQLSVDVGVNARTPQHHQLVHPVEETETDGDQYCSARDQRRVEISKPHRFGHLRVLLAYTVARVLHEQVGLLLCKVLAAEVPPAFEEVDQLPGVDQPDDGDQEGVEEEHHGLLLDDAERLAVDVAQADALHHQSHQRSGEEEPERVLQPEGELELAAGAVHLDVGDVVQQGGDHKLVEEGDEHHGEDGDQCGRAFAHVVHGLGFSVKEEVKDGSDCAEQEGGQQPPHCQPHRPHRARGVDVLPDDLLRLGRTLHHDAQALDSEVLQQHVGLHFCDLLDEGVLLPLGGEHHHCLVTDGSVPADHLHLLEVLLPHQLLPLLDLAVEVGEPALLLPALRLVHPLLLAAHQLQLLLLQLEEVLERVQHDHLLHLVLAVERSQETADLADAPHLFGQVHEDDGVVGDEGVALLVVLERLEDGVADVDEGEELDDEGAHAQQRLLGAHLRLRPHEDTQPAVADALVVVGQVVRLALYAHPVRALHRPVEAHHAVAHDLQRQQDHRVLVEDEVEREAEPQELQLLRVLAQRDGRLVNHPQAALAEVAVALTQQSLHLARRTQPIGVHLLQKPRRARPPVVRSHLPVWIQIVEVQHSILNKIVQCNTLFATARRRKLEGNRVGSWGTTGCLLSQLFLKKQASLYKFVNLNKSQEFLGGRRIPRTSNPQSRGLTPAVILRPSRHSRPKCQLR